MNNNSTDRMVNSHFSKNNNQTFSSFKDSQNQSQRQGSQQNGAKVININKLNINIQQYQNPGL